MAMVVYTGTHRSHPEYRCGGYYTGLATYRHLSFGHGQGLDVDYAWGYAFYNGWGGSYSEGCLDTGDYLWGLVYQHHRGSYVERGLDGPRRFLGRHRVSQKDWQW